ncbi:MAG TPA: AIR synthase-related protein, partial [Bacteroidales bacterium]|nr:AIR synthase-related protein [Bacteroidales bacterium]
IKASNGASDFGNKFGQPLICGSLYTFEQKINNKLIAYDKIIMLAGGIGYALKKYAHKKTVRPGQSVIMMGGDNYRIGMGGGAVSSVATGKYENNIERNAVQRANPEMQKRVFNVIRALSENNANPIISIHDHGAGGHLNCFAELLNPIGGEINIDALPLGDPSLSDKEIICNESQERMGLVVDNGNYEKIEKIALRERAPIYKVGKIYPTQSICFIGKDNRKPFDLKFDFLFGKTPKTIIRDNSIKSEFINPKYNLKNFEIYLEKVLSNEAVACKDWLTNKVDRSVTGRVALQQTCGKIQLPLNNLGITALDYSSKTGIAFSIGHAPNVAIIDSAKASRLAVAEALTNIVWTPLRNGLEGISLSANWMWPSGLPGEDARLYDAVKSLSDFCLQLKINVPTGKDSLSLSQNYPDGTVVKGPGTVIVTASGVTDDFTAAVTPDLKNVKNSSLIYINFSGMAPALGGSIFYQELGNIGSNPPDVANADYFKRTFTVLQDLIRQNLILAGHDISAGGLITTLLEMT